MSRPSKGTPVVKFPRRLLIVLVVSVGSMLCSSTSAWVTSTSQSNAANEAGSRSNQVDVAIPGPLRSFLRMAGISQKAPTDEVLALLGHNVASQGFEVGGRPTEFLILLSRYVQQARELVLLASPNGVIRVSNCDEAAPLLRILSYRTRQHCGNPATFLETTDHQPASLTL